jgi:beta-N-acetylhexosaminidase
VLPLSRLVVTGLPGPALTPAIRRRLARLAPGGVVLFRRNVESPAQVARLLRDVRAVLGRGTLIAVDQEGGRVARLRAPFTEWPPMRRIGDLGRAPIARAVGRALGRELAAAGFNCDFAPVLDVDSNPRNPVIGDRSFGRDPRLVARLGVAFAAGLEEAGVLACGKHFPGHGDTDLDSHLALPIVRRPLRELSRIELSPFRAAIRAGIPMLMTAHVVYRALDPDHPATVSAVILRDLLRDRLGFRGVVVSDDLAMHALDGVGAAEDVALRCLEAGCDWLLACQSLDDGERIADALRAASRRRRSLSALARLAVVRVAALRRRLSRLPIARERLGDVLARREGSALLARLAPRPSGGERPGGAPDAAAARARDRS